MISDVLKCEKHASESSRPLDVMVVEFARADYTSAFKLLNEKSLFQPSHCLLFEAQIATCVQRIRGRVQSATSLDDHFTSEVILANYDQAGYIHSIVTMLEENYQVDAERIRKIDNSSSNSRPALDLKLSEFVDSLKLKQPVLAM